MSLVCITSHDECIYDAEKEEPPPFEKPPLYYSKFRKNRPHQSHELVTIIKGSGEEVKSKFYRHNHKTMGYAKHPVRSPCNFLKKNDGIHFRRVKDHECIKKDLPRIPERIPKSECQQKPSKNFTLENVLKVKNLTPNRPKPRYAITRNGDVEEICNAGILPAYVYNPNFGKVPKYLEKIKSEICQGRGRGHEYDSDAESDTKGDGLKLICAEERNQVLTGLKKNWLELQKSYQGLPVLTDTIHKKHRKIKLEKQLRKLEEDIWLMESNPLIYVCENDDDGNSESKNS